MYAYAKILVAVVALALVTSACENPVEDDHDNDHEHAEAEGLVLMSEGNELVRVESAQVSDTMIVALDESIDIEVEFLDEDGDHIHAEDFDEEFSLDWEVSDENALDDADVVVITVTSTGDWSFSVEGAAAGEATLTVKLMHGEHADFTTPGIPVRVE